MCKLNAAALDTTVACGYNGIDQHNLGLLPPSRGLIEGVFCIVPCLKLLPPSRGLIHCAECGTISFSLLPPIAGIDTPEFLLIFRNLAIAPIAGIDTKISKAFLLSFTIAPPIVGIDTPCRERSAAQRRRPFHTLPFTFHTPSLRSPPHFPFR